jgi:hypothetical protein
LPHVTFNPRLTGSWRRDGSPAIHPLLPLLIVVVGSTGRRLSSVLELERHRRRKTRRGMARGIGQRTQDLGSATPNDRRRRIWPSSTPRSDRVAPASTSLRCRPNPRKPLAGIGGGLAQTRLPSGGCREAERQSMARVPPKVGDGTEALSDCGCGGAAGRISRRC